MDSRSYGSVDALMSQWYMLVQPPRNRLFTEEELKIAHQRLDDHVKGDFRTQAGYLGLGQELAADAAADIFFLADLRPILQRFGNRGYRAVQLEAGILGGRLYLGAYAQRLGATGLTFT